MRVIGGYRALREALERYKAELYRYNSLISGTGFYLKPLHVVTKRSPDGGRIRYIYVGRYWWRISYAGKKGRTSRVKWVYVGTEKPRELKGFPDPPNPPLAGLRAAVEGDDVILDERTFEKYRWLFEGHHHIVECGGRRQA